MNELKDLDCLRLLAVENVEGEFSLIFEGCDVNTFKMFKMTFIY